MNGILMTPDNHKAIRDKLKTQTRRLDHLKEINKSPNLWKWIGYDQAGRFSFRFEPSGDVYNYFPRYRAGETVYLKEAWATEKQYDHLSPANLPDNAYVHFVANGVGDYPLHIVLGKRRSPMFLPEHLARDYIKITEVGLGQLNDITEEDAKAEGAECVIWRNDYAFAYDKFIAMPTYRAGFANLWDSINGKPTRSKEWTSTYDYAKGGIEHKHYIYEPNPNRFEASPWVWRICFNLIEDKR